MNIGEDALAVGLQIAEKLRDHDPDRKVITHLGGGSLKSQFKKADKSGARWALILAADEISQNNITVKDLSDGQQQTIAQADLIEFLRVS
jgi:histidyl-tRNA synthetase